MRGRRPIVIALVMGLALLPGPGRAQMVPACPRGSGIITPTTLGSLVMREGDGLSGVSLGAAASVERAWGPPSECVSQPRGYDVRRVYGTPTIESQNAIGYTAEGVAFFISRNVVGGILVFPPGTVPPGWRLP